MIGIIYTYVIYIYLQTSRSCSSRRSPSQRKPASRIKRRLAIRAADAPAISSNKACRYDPQVSHAVSRARNNTVLLRHRAACQQCPRGSSGRGSCNACKRQANAHTHTHTHTHTLYIYIYIYIYIYDRRFNKAGGQRSGLSQRSRRSKDAKAAAIRPLFPSLFGVECHFHTARAQRYNVGA